MGFNWSCCRLRQAAQMDDFRTRHHEQPTPFQKCIRNHVNKLSVELQNFGNPFIDIDNNKDLIQLETEGNE